MIGYKKTLNICILQYFLILGFHVIYSIFFCNKTQIQKTIIWSACIFICFIFFAVMFQNQETLVTGVCLGTVLLSAYYIGVVLRTLAFSLLIYMVSALILSLFLKKKYILYWGCITTLAAISYTVFFPEIILEATGSIPLYVFYIFVYAVSMVNLYVLVANAKKYLDAMKEKAHEAEIASSQKSIFLASISNEIRTPMNVICGMSQLLNRENLSGKEKEYSKNIQDAGKQLLSLIDDVLNLTQIETGKIDMENAEYDFFQTIHDITNQISRKADIERVRIITCINPRIPKNLEGDEKKIRQIIYKIMEDSAINTSEGEIRIDADIDKEYNGVDDITLIIHIMDTSGRTRENLCSGNNYQDNADGNSITGLALSISQKMVELMGGEIGVENLLHKGVVFTLKIPQKVASDKEYAKIDDVASHDMWVAPKAKVLVVDDTISSLKMMRGLLEVHGIDAECVESGQEAINKMEDTRYDIVFVDYLMPEMDGLETLKEIRKRQGQNFATVPVIVLTTNAKVIDNDNYRKMGFSDCLSKPFDTERLEVVLKRYLE